MLRALLVHEELSFALLAVLLLGFSLCIAIVLAHTEVTIDHPRAVDVTLGEKDATAHHATASPVYLRQARFKSESFAVPSA